MTTGIRAALEFPHDPARLRVVVFLTDGFIGNEDEILALVEEKLGPSRLFSFGVGSAVNRYLLEEMAALGRGTVQVVRPDEDTTAAVERLQARIDKPVLTDVEIDWKDLAVSGVTPARVPDLFADQPITLHGRYARGGRATITIRGRMAGRKVSFDVPVELPETRDREGVAATWARARIAELSRKQLRGEQEALKKEIIDLALEHHLMTQYTAFVAVDTTRTTSGGEAQTVAVPVDVPEGVKAPKPYAGYGGGGSVGGVGMGTVGYGSGGGYAAAYDGGGGVYAQHAAPPVQYSLKLEGRIDAEVAERDELEALLKSEPARYDKGDAPASPAPPPVARPAEEAKPDPKKAKDTSTTETAMRAQVSKCWLDENAGGSATIDVDVSFDATGAATSVSVKGADAKVTACITAKAKKWRGAKRAVMTLAF
jgi:Ca-activated chloride channel family protein